MWKSSWSIGIRARILLFQAIIAMAVLVMAGVVYVAIRSADYYVNRTAWTNQQLRAISEVAVAANRYSEQIAEMLLIGPPERADFDSAQAALEASFAKLEQSSREEIAFLEAPEEEEQDVQRVVERLGAARKLYGFDARMGDGQGATAYRGDGGGSTAPARRTDISAALEFSADLLRAAPMRAPREVINICGNGDDNVHASPAAARDRALAAGMVVNGLVIGARPAVADYYRAYLQGGTGSFVLEVRDPKDVAAAMLQKFLRDLNVAREPPGTLAGLPLQRAAGADQAAPARSEI